MIYKIHKDKDGYYISYGYSPEVEQKSDSIQIVNICNKTTIWNAGLYEHVKFVGDIAYLDSIESCEKFIEHQTKEIDKHVERYKSDVVKIITT